LITPVLIWASPAGDGSVPNKTLRPQVGGQWRDSSSAVGIYALWAFMRRLLHGNESQFGAKLSECAKELSQRANRAKYPIFKHFAARH
jgi:hypothetical protein